MAKAARPSPRRKPTTASALLLVDMINAFDFPGGDALARAALPCARRIAGLKSRMTALGLPIIYANDNYGQWRSDFRQVVATCGDSELGAPLIKLLHPQADDYFVLKPAHSAFHDTPLQALLERLGVSKLVITGIATDSCVLATSLEGHMRHYRLYVPEDCTAALTPARKARALRLLRETLEVDARKSAWITQREMTGD
ncbi:cysteine hydrolase family protein [Lysobacter silvisoli]|uniref:Cysteine hydrolase n=1 Tax=Lysobacter silvisoli TaxID=2293254 RepID=A0A371K330_9GAMM|nr:isochorismatase family cysteine hydrolase [Lysobacter silvisoli]RDZ28326.1 cysteine hydrolase [Lysobacter silvisoli]